MRTLIVSDFHLGSRLGHDVLRRPEPLKRLLDAIDGVERLVLLGDAIELMEGRQQRAFEVATPVLRAIAEQLGPDRRLTIVPGNHDAPLVRAWVRRRGRSLEPTTSVPADATPALARITSLMSATRVDVSYPGTWVSHRVWATHGHYLDRHLMPVSGYGILRGFLRRSREGSATPYDYERGRRPSATRLSGSMPRPIATLVDDFAELVRAATMPHVRRHLLNRRFAPLTAALLSAQMRRASIPAITRVARRLGIDADWVVFGHVHRLGPLADDDPLDWSGPNGRPRVANCGSWLYEPLLVHRASPPHPYWPGGAVIVDDDDDPRANGLLDDIGADALR